MAGRRDLFCASKDLPFGVYDEQMGATEGNTLFLPLYLSHQILFGVKREWS